MPTNVITPADGYLTSAISAFNGLQALEEAPRLGPRDKVRSCSILAALATECALKHHLAKSNIPESVVKGYRHDLVELWRAAQAAGLSVDFSPPDWCQTLSAITGSPLFFARYGYGAAGAVIFPPEFLVAEIDRLIRQIYPAQPPLLPRIDGTPRITLPP